MSTILNSDFDLLSATDTVSREARASFRDVPTRVLLAIGTRLNRLVTNEGEAGHRGNVVIGAFWYSSTEWSRLVAQASRSGAPIAAVARARLAVAEKWNPTLGNLIRIELTTPVVAWEGVARHQRAGDDSTVILMGGARQLYIPGLQVAGDPAPRSKRAGSGHARILGYASGVGGEA